MKTIALFSQKGGTGKTTLCVHLAVAAEQAGQRVAILDLDPQGSAAAWHKLRGANATPVTVQLPDAELARAIEGAKADGFDLVIIDAPPHVAPIAVRIVGVSDLVLVPVRPSPIDIAALPATVALIGQRRSAFVLSACPPRAPEIQETRMLLTQYQRPVFGAITDRRSFFRAITAGKAVSEFEPDSHAAKEIAALYAASMQELFR